MELTQTVKAFVAGFREAVVAERQNAEPRVIRALALIVFILFLIMVWLISGD